MRLFVALIASLFWAFPAWAQDAPAGNVPPDVAAQTPLPVFADQAEWDDLAGRAGVAVADGRASNAVLRDLRAQLAGWRDRFQARQSLNAQRIGTVRAQIAALGAAPETGTEDPRITARRSVLEDQLQELRAPGLLAQEAASLANGLIGEIDTLIRERQTDRFTERNASPLLPQGWSRAWDVTVVALRATWFETTSAMNNPSRQVAALDRLPSTLVYLAIALVLLLRGRNWVGRFEGMMSSRSLRGQGVWRFILSLGQIVLPFLGLLALSNAIETTGMVGGRASDLVANFAWFGLFPILSHWLVGILLPKGVPVEHQPLSFDPETAVKVGRRFVLMGYVLFVMALVMTFIASNALDSLPAAVLMFPIGAVLAWTLYWLGHAMRRSDRPDDDSGSRTFRQALRGILSRGLKVTAVAGLVLSAIGYGNAIELILVPSAMTIYVMGILVLLQRLSVDAYALVSSSESAAQDALFPVLIGFGLMLLSLPVLALVWGAQVTDLTELWTQFGEGFSLGETQISPTNFLTFAIVFAVGYAVTRLSQGALRSTVLPRTKLDAGGKDAIVAGVGYLGVFLAAVVAISTAGIDLSGLAIVAGALSVGIGFGLQNIVSNFISGIILLIERPISQGDWIEVGGQMGYVRDISVRSTRIETFDRTDVIVPNADLISNQVINWTRGNSVGRVIVPVGVAYGTDTTKVAAILTEIAEAHPMVLLNPPPAIIFQGFGADSLDFEIRAILRDVNYVMTVKSEMNHAIAKRFDDEGIEIPFAQRDIWLRNPEVLKGTPQ